MIDGNIFVVTRVSSFFLLSTTVQIFIVICLANREVRLRSVADPQSFDFLCTGDDDCTMWDEAYTACVQGMRTVRCGMKLTLPVYRG